MGLFGGFKAASKTAQLQEHVAAMETEIANLRSMLTPEHIQAADIKTEIANLSKSLASLRNDHRELSDAIEARKRYLISIEETEELQDFGIYEPRFDFQTVDEYDTKLKQIREMQKSVVKRMNKEAGESTWTVNGSSAQGKKMIRETTKLLMTAFNSECDEIVRKTKFSNVEKSRDNIKKLADKISKLGSTMGISIPYDYVSLKQEEVSLQYEYSLFKQKEKERIRELRAQEREEAKVRKEIEEKRKALEKERKQKQSALDDLLKRLDTSSDDDRKAIEEKIEQLNESLGEIEKSKTDLDYREANKRAGFVYIISNIGSFGEGVYKIGMTRRLDPMERVYELGDASVPFNFDVHAMIFTEDAPALESALHREFEDRKLNMVNQRREFFRVSLDEIEAVVKANYDKTVEFVRVPDAEQYRVSQKMRESNNS